MDRIKHAILHLTLFSMLLVIDTQAIQLLRMPQKLVEYDTSPSYEDSTINEVDDYNQTTSLKNSTAGEFDFNFENTTGRSYELNHNTSLKNSTEGEFDYDSNDFENTTGRSYELNGTNSYPYSTSTARYSTTFRWITNALYPPTTTSTPNYSYTPFRWYNNYTTTTASPGWRYNNNNNNNSTSYPYWRRNYTTSTYPYWQRNYTTSTSTYPYWRNTASYGHRYPYGTTYYPYTTTSYPYISRQYGSPQQQNNGQPTTQQPVKPAGSNMNFNTFNGPVILKICAKCRFYFHGQKMNNTDQIKADRDINFI